ncbi:MAG: hypothetical protein QOG74_292 [Alphaproteobacteria bacterium]|nr:hypothetical protein [Alphaproteobacteria bacterium]
MSAIHRRTIIAAVAACGLTAMIPAVLPAQVPADDKALGTALRAGGHVILVRHGATFADQADTDPLNFDNVAAQRALNDKGKALAKAFGEALRQAGIPMGKVYTSRYNRAYETAALAGFTDIEKTADLTEGGLVVSPNENNAGPKPCASCWRQRRSRAPIPFWSPTSRTSSTHSERIGST